MTSATETELRSQPEMWERAVALAPQHADALSRRGERVLIVGCGTSWFIASAYAKLREAAGEGVTDAATATEISPAREYDRVIALSRSGTTSEIITMLQELGDVPSVLITAVAGGPASEHADSEIVLGFADETSVVQTRFATTALAFLRASLGEDLTAAIADARTVLGRDLDPVWTSADQITFLGTGWTKGLADEAGLKLREASQSWTESYYAMEYRHGPIAIAQPGRLTVQFGAAPTGLAEQTEKAGSRFLTSELDPMAQLVEAQLAAVARAEASGLDPDKPRHLTRAVHLS